MKKVIIVVLVFFVLFSAGVFLFIPATLLVSNIAIAHCSATGANRAIAKKENWKKFWQGNQHITQASTFTDTDFFIYQNDTFQVTQLLQNAVQISIASNRIQNKSTLLFLPFAKDSVQIVWSYQTSTSYNPFKRIRVYKQAVETKRNIVDVLQNIVQFVNKNENIYGFAVQQTSTKDTFLVSTKMMINTYPSTAQVYTTIEKLQAYAKENGGKQTGNPMMNITQLTKNSYVLMTAIPVNKLLPEKGEITYKRMVPGNFLTATVTGGTATVNNAQTQMQQYFQDYNRTAMAIPFQYLITDRSKESDSSKWITKLYYPVM